MKNQGLVLEIYIQALQSLIEEATEEEKKRIKEYCYMILVLACRFLREGGNYYRFRVVERNEQVMSQQISIFDEECIVDNEDDNNQVIATKEPIPYVGQKVKIKLPEEIKSETYQYLYYYFGSLLTKVGEVMEIKLYPSGNYTCTVDFFGTILLLNPEHLYLL